MNTVDNNLTNPDASGAGWTSYTPQYATNATNQSGGTVNAVGGISQNGILLVNNTTPTIASGFGTGSYIGGANGTASFFVEVGGGGTASTGIVSMPPGGSYWNCSVIPENPSTWPANTITTSHHTTSTTITLSNYLVSTGAPTPWASLAVLTLNCINL